jgi:hypothetical protein
MTLKTAREALSVCKNTGVSVKDVLVKEGFFHLSIDKLHTAAAEDILHSSSFMLANGSNAAKELVDKELQSLYKDMPRISDSIMRCVWGDYKARVLRSLKETQVLDNVASPSPPTAERHRTGNFSFSFILCL